MNRDLLARTSVAFYDGWSALAREADISEKNIEASSAESIRTAKALLDGKCPKCGAASARYVDYARQEGPSEVPGVWVMYLCSTAPPPGQPRRGACDFMRDFKEGEAAN